MSDNLKEEFMLLQLILVVIYGVVIGTVMGYVCKLLGLDVILSGAVIGALTGITTIFIFSKAGKR